MPISPHTPIVLLQTECLRLPQIHVQILMLIVMMRRDGLRRWLGQEGKSLVNGIPVLRKETPESSLVPLLYKDTEDSYLWTGKQILGRRQICLCLHLEFPSLKNKCLYFKPPSLWHFCYSSLNGLNHHPCLKDAFYFTSVPIQGKRKGFNNDFVNLLFSFK